MLTQEDYRVKPNIFLWLACLMAVHEPIRMKIAQGLLGASSVLTAGAIATVIRGLSILLELAAFGGVGDGQQNSNELSRCSMDVGGIYLVMRTLR
jgi:hypothetical protein